MQLNEYKLFQTQSAGSSHYYNLRKQIWNNSTFWGNLPQKNVKLPENDIHKAVRKEQIKS